MLCSQLLTLCCRFSNVAATALLTALLAQLFLARAAAVAAAATAAATAALRVRSLYRVLVCSLLVTSATI